jgi:hypothetical protein
MEAALITALLAEPFRTTTPQEYEELKQLAERFPYYAGFHALLAKQALVHEADPKAFVTKAAAFAPDRLVLRKLMDSKPLGAKSPISFAKPPVSKPVTLVTDVADAPEAAEVWVVDPNQINTKAEQIVDDGKPSWMKDTNEKPVWLIDEEGPKAEVIRHSSPVVVTQSIPEIVVEKLPILEPEEEITELEEDVFEPELSEDVLAQLQNSDELVDELLNELDKLRSLKKTNDYFGKASNLTVSAHQQYDIELAKLHHDYSEGHEPIVYIEESPEEELTQQLETTQQHELDAQPLSLYERMMAEAASDESTTDANPIFVNDANPTANWTDNFPQEALDALDEYNSVVDVADLDQIQRLVDESELDANSMLFASSDADDDQILGLEEEDIEAEIIPLEVPQPVVDEYKELSQQEIINKFLDANPRSININQANPDQPIYDLSAQNNTLSDDDMTETLAQIMVRQGKMDKAIEIYCKLILKNPEKTPYFASRINALATAMGQN